jgi:hypothetical protein
MFVSKNMNMFVSKNMNMFVSQNMNMFDGENSILHFNPFSEEQSLPFPLYLKYPSILFISLTLLISLLIGLKFRAIIFFYLKAPETKIGPINFLIWIDQINGLLLGVTIMLRLIMINNPYPLSETFGKTFCEWIDLPGCIYLVGSYIWSCLTAIYRILLLKAQTWVNEFGEFKLLSIFLMFGTFLLISSSLWLAMFDYRSISQRMCFHYSIEEAYLFQTYQVTILITNY